MGNEIFGHSFTNSSDPNWVPEPGTRGTFSILSVCLVTLGLCVWTAIHLNVPEHNEPGWKQLMRKIGWLMLSLLSPEIIAYTAYQQYVQARVIMNVMNEETERPWGSKLLRMWTHIRGFITSWGSSQRRPTDEEAPRPTARRWTMVHGFLAVMGGIAIEMNNDGPQTDPTNRIMNFFPNKEFNVIHWQHGLPTLTKSQRQRSRLTVTTDGLRFLKMEGHGRLIPNISEERIRDKRKGSTMAKTLVCLQASWFCVQCLTRFAQGLAISLLELNTLGHAICTLFIYALWWDKPLDIIEPETVSIHPSTMPEELEKTKLIAAMCSASKLDKDAPELNHCGRRVAMFAFPLYRDTKGSACHLDLSGLPWEKPPHDDKRLNLTHSFYNEWERLIVAPIRQIVLCAVKNPGLYLRVEQSSALLEMVRLYPQEEHVVTLAESDDKTDRDWSAIRLLCEERSCSASRSQDSSPDSTSTTGMPYNIVVQYSDIIRWQLSLGLAQLGLSMPPKDSFTDRVRNLPRFQDYDTYFQLFINIGFVGLIYGGLHCVAWNAPFTTSVERILWRISSITIAATGVLVACMFSWTKFPPLWREPIGVFKKPLDLLTGQILDLSILAWCIGCKPSHRLKEVFERQPSYKNNWLVWLLCNMAVWLLHFPATVLLVSTYFTLCLLKILLDIFTVLFGVLYVLARIYLVVISFINLAHLPDSAYQLPQWSRYFPHIG